MDGSIQRRTRDAFVLVVLVPVILGGLGVWTAHHYRQNIALISHTKAVLAAINKLLLSITTAENNQHGFLLTGERQYLDGYFIARKEVPAELSQLRILTRDNPVEQENLRLLSPLVDARLQEMDELLTLNRSGERTPSRASSLLGTGRGLMKGILDRSSAMDTEENRLLIGRTAAQETTETEVAVSFVFGLLVNVALLYWAYQLIKQYGLARDIAEMEIRQLNTDLEKRVQERTAELEDANGRLSRSNEDLTSFAYIASHDLQEPLRTVGSYAGLLGRRYQGKLDEQADKYIHFMVDGAKRMQTLVQDLLAYSRIGTQALESAPVNMQAVVEQAKENLQVMLAERKGQILTGDLPTLYADEGKLTLVFQNLIANALKFSKPSEPPVVQIRAERQGGQWIFSVADNGIGFDPAYADRIFVMFQRLHQMGTYTGTGIGLAICKRIVEGHGGRIWAKSEPSVGSTFYVSLPANPGVQSRLH